MSRLHVASEGAKTPIHLIILISVGCVIVSFHQTMAKKSADAHDFLVVGIGASAGGIGALKQLFDGIPSDCGMAFVVILHLSPDHESNLAAILQQKTAMTVTQVTETVKVEPNHVYVIPPTKHLEMMDGVIQLADLPTPVRGRRVPIDIFFRTLADAWGKFAICVVLSGTGSDGALGLKRVKEVGGIALVQDPTEAEYDGMPRCAIGTGLVDIVLPLDELQKKLLSLRRFSDVIELPGKEETPGGAVFNASPDPDADPLLELLRLVRARTGHDFSSYKRPTLLRRLARRMQVRESADLPTYLGLLRNDSTEAQTLQRDLLITVTNFFRDKEAFAAFEQEVVPKLFAGKRGDDSVRVWVAACATGEEVYSIAMLLHEYASNIVDPPSIQIFASDINESAINVARQCRYDGAIVADVSPERLRRYFTKEGETYQVRKEIRELVMFAPHNLLRDPPFSRLDLISCRNLMIYLNRETQERVLALFHFALRPDGFLLLGSSETAGGAPSLFTAIDAKQRVYKCREMFQDRPVAPALPITGKWQVNIPKPPDESRDSVVPLHHKLLEQYAPPSVLVDEDYNIVNASSRSTRFLRFPSGLPSQNLLKVVLPGLQVDLRAALLQAKQENQESRSVDIAVDINGEERLISLTVCPAELKGEQGFFLVVFAEVEASGAAQNKTPSIREALAGDQAMVTIVRRLETELQQARDRLRSTIEQNEISNEEHKASNEELQAINEELRSASEELETSKEELQSVNEELATVNHELKEKMEEATRASSDTQNLMSSTDIATIFLDRALKIKRYTPLVRNLFNIIPTDVGRPLDHFTHKLDHESLIEDAAEVLRTLQTEERETRSSDGRFYLVRLAPYRTLDDRIDGVVLSFQDVTELKRASEALQEADLRKNEFLATLAHELRNPLAAIRPGLAIVRHGDEEKREIAYRIIERQLDQIVRLVDDLLDVSRITQGKIELQLERIETSMVVELALETARPFIDAAGHELIVEFPSTPLFINADKTRLTQVFINLLNNSSRYTRPGGQIRLAVRSEGKQAVVSIRDTGVGISPEMLPHIFDLFTQGRRAVRRSQGGLGVGLSLVKRLMELHNGSVEGYSDGVDHGSEFIVRVPLATNQEPLPPPVSVAPSVASASRKILIVDDNVDSASMLEIFLTMQTHEVSVANDGEAAVKAALEIRPDLIFLDLGLPDLDGYEVASRIRVQLPETLIVALSGWGQESDRRRTSEAGFDRHLVKPLDFGELPGLLAAAGRE